MKQSYQHQELEAKWQKRWAESHLYRTKENPKLPKYYILDMFPYPSGAGLHVGHPKGYIATDIVARCKTMQGFRVLHPMGWDAFGLPAENYAIKNKVHPAVATAKNVAVFKKQLQSLGFSYDWEREINTTDSEFYRWTQWIFLQLYHHYYDKRLNRAQPIEKLIEKKFGTNDYYALDDQQKAVIDSERLAFEEFAPINWCPSCQTGLANEDLEDGKCERCGSVIEKKPMRQWNLRITKYAERMLADLVNLEWEEFIKTMQINWIGKSVGAEIDFVLQTEQESSLAKLTVFTTRLDTLFGCTYVVMSPEHPLLEKILPHLSQALQVQVKDYCAQAQQQSEQERTRLNRDKTGIALEGIEAINPINGELVPVWLADYVLADYGTGAVMAVPAHDERDGDFASKFNLPIKTVIKPTKAIKNKGDSARQTVFTNDGILVESAQYTNLSSQKARERILADLHTRGLARAKINYKLREWVFSRQRYWGEPIPIIHCPHCGLVPLKESDLPLNLPAVEHYQPSGTGESPLVNIASWVEVKCPRCQAAAKRETNTMPQWAGSSWYYLRYLDPDNQFNLVSSEREQAWMPVDFYVGGAEHATRHLIYARFWHKFLYDLGLVSTTEPFKKLQHVGLILAEDGRKMSKRWGNVINPDEIVKNYGADTMRIYEMFMGPFGSACAWSTKSLKGSRRFLEKVWGLQEKLGAKKPLEADDQALLQQTIAKVTSDIGEFKLNTAVSSLMILTNLLASKEKIHQDDYEVLIKLLAPFVPHLTEQLWENLGYKKSIFTTSWPVFKPELSQKKTLILPIQINGKLRDRLELDVSGLSDENYLWQQVLAREKVKAKLNGKKIRQKIYVPGKIVNLLT